MKSQPHIVRCLPLLCLALASASFGQAPFTEGFEDGLADGWTNYDIGAYRVTDSPVLAGDYALELGTDGNQTALIRDEWEAGHGIYGAWFYVEEASTSEVSIVFQTTGVTDWYAVYFRPAGAGHDELTFEKMVGGVYSEVMWVPHAVGVDEWFHIQINRYASGDRAGDIDVYLNGSFLIMEHDESFMGPGTMGVLGRNGAYVDNIAFTPFETSCCSQRVGDANMSGADEPTIGDVSILIDAKFISVDPELLTCMAEADINQSGGADPTFDDVTIGDISYLIDYLFISIGLLDLNECLNTGGQAPPQNLIGIPMHIDDGPLQIVLVWTDSLRELTFGYNIYRTIGDGSPVKLNESLVVEMPLGPGVESVWVLAYFDATLDTLSLETHRYYVTAVTPAEESGPSEEVVFVPADINLSSEVTGLTPAYEAEVDLNPTFGWDPYPGAVNYWMYVQDREGNMPVLWWYGTNQSSATYPATDGITYGEASQPSLPYCHPVGWAVGAVNANNFTIAQENDGRVNTPCDWLVILDSPSLAAGSWYFCWDQTDGDGLQVPVGDYKVVLETPSLPHDSWPEMIVEVSSDGGLTDVPPYCHLNPVGGGGVIPTSFRMFTSMPAYGIGESLVVNFELPTTADVVIRVSRTD